MHVRLARQSNTPASCRALRCLLGAALCVVISSSCAVRGRPMAPMALPQVALTRPKLAAMLPHWAMQETLASCSVATATTLINTMLAQRGRGLMTQAQVLATDLSGQWARNTADEASLGVTLEQMAMYLMLAMHQAGIRGMTVDVVHLNPDLDSVDDDSVKLKQALLRLEAADDNYFMVANFLQSAAVQGGSDEGHLSPVGAYDRHTDRVLVLDVDRWLNAAYWLPLSTFQSAMSTRGGSTGEYRGFLVVHLS